LALSSEICSRLSSLRELKGQEGKEKNSENQKESFIKRSVLNVVLSLLHK